MIHLHPFKVRLINDVFPLEKHRSPISQQQIEEDLQEFYNKTIESNDPAFQLAVANATMRFKLPSRAKLLHLNDVFKQDLDIWSKSPGLPWTTFGIKTKGMIRDDPKKVGQVRHFWHRLKYGEEMSFPDCCAFAESHVCDVTEIKCCAMWDYPATITFSEAIFAIPLIRSYQSLPEFIRPIAYGFETFNGEAYKSRRRFPRAGGYYSVEIDFEKLI